MRAGRTIAFSRMIRDQKNVHQEDAGSVPEIIMMQGVMQSIVILVPAGLASLLIAWFTTSRLVSTSGRLRALDIPNHRSSHRKPTPRTGGLGIALASTLILPVLALFLPTLPNVANPLFTVSFWLVMLGYVTIAAVGLIDDVKQIGPLPKYLGQFLAALIAILAGVIFLQLDLPLIGRIEFTSFGFLGSFTGIVLTVVWLTGFSNIFNFMDGIDGLAAGSGAIQGLALFLLSNPSGWQDGAGYQLSGASSLMLAAACLGFLAHNFPPARIFMGDVGSLFTGYVLAATAVLMAGTGSHPVPFVSILLVFSPFLYDATLTILLRWRRGENLLEAHRSHLYQRLIASGQSHRQVTLTYYGLNLITAGGGLFCRAATDRSRIAISVICLTILIGFTIYVYWFEARAGRLRPSAPIATKV